MALVLTDDQRMLKDAATGFFGDKAPVSQLRELRDRKDETGFDPSLWAQMAEMGFAGVLVPEKYGGSGFGAVGAGIILEQIGRNLSLSPMLSTAVLGATALMQAATEAQRQALLPQLAAGNLLLALAIDETARHNPAHVKTRAEPSGNGFKLSGVKSFVLDGHVADKFIVSARTSDKEGSKEGITLFLVDRNAAGVHVERTLMVDSRNAARVTLSNVQVSGDDVIGLLDGGFATLDCVLDTGRVCLAAEMLGVADESFRSTVEYLKQREQFGAKIGSFQALQHRAAHLFCEIELARSVVLRALQALDEEDPRVPAFASMAKAKVGDVVKLATNEAVQIHGGIGMTDEFDIGFFMKRARAAAETFGDMAFHGHRLARLTGY